ncbi:hypothetical protein [Cellulosimicrobium cellulans]|uniref:hypothetical protein n=1 Tax=Cellulosimicrobium cellulans TaxID=1710 RepID=UPI0006849BDA|nr:hypothetical protein [Cellulosimicrobium cellulans]
MLIDRPWTRVRNPTPIPASYTAADLRAMPDLEFAELVRSHLVPRDVSRAGRAAWDKLWLTLRNDADLADRTYNILEEFLDATEDVLDRGELEDEQRKRAAKFAEQCRQSWARIDREPPQGALSWAGKAGDFQPAARRVIATLVGAIASHRSTVTGSPDRAPEADDRLWAVLRQVDLDPDDYPTRHER